MTKDNFKFDVRVRDRMRRRNALSAQDVDGYLQALPDVSSNAHVLDIVDPSAHEGAGRGFNGGGDAG